MNSTFDPLVPVFLDPNYIPKNFLERFWHYSTINYGERNLFVISYLILLAVYLLSGFIFWVMEQYRMFPNYRLQPGVKKKKKKNAIKKILCDKKKIPFNTNQNILNKIQNSKIFFKKRKNK